MHPRTAREVPEDKDVFAIGNAVTRAIREEQEERDGIASTPNVAPVVACAFGIGAIAAPFLLGYSKRAPVVTATQVACGAATIVASLFTGYRGARGVSR